MNTSDTPKPYRRQDPILEELWQIRAELNAEANGDFRKLAEIVKRESAPYFDEHNRVRGLAELGRLGITIGRQPK